MTAAAIDLLRPEWPAPAGIGALCSLRGGGVSGGAWASLNLGDAVGDAPAAVAENRRRLQAATAQDDVDQPPAQPVYLRQVHGARVVRIGKADLQRQSADEPPHEADAALTTEAGIACCVQVADCLPVLFCSADGRAVAAAHAGWRGLAAGVLEHTMAAFDAAIGARPEALHAWLGPSIGPRHFEVGDDVREAFPGLQAHFIASRRADGSAAWLADLPALAKARLMAAGVRSISGGGWCTVADASRFFSFRRDRITGRHAALVWRRG